MSHCGILALFDRDISCVGGSDETGLWQRVLQRKQFVLGDHLGTGLEGGPGPYGGQVEALLVPQGYVAPVVLARKVAILQMKKRLLI